MDVLVAGDVYRAEVVLDLLEHVALGRAEGARDFEVDAQRRLPDALALVGACEAARLFEYFVADRLRRLHKPRALAVGTGGAERALQRLLDALARHNDQAEVVEGENLRRRLVLPERVLKGLHHARAVPALLHVYEVEDDDAAEVAKPDLPRDLFDRLHVGARDRVFETRAAAAYELARVHVNGDQRLGLVDDEVAAGAEPHARLDGLINLGLYAVGFEYRLLARVELDAVDEAGLDAVDELDDFKVLLLAVNAYGREVVGELVAQEALHQVEVFVDERRGLLLLGAAAYVAPGAYEVARVVAQVLLRNADAGGADDEAARRHVLFLDDGLDELAQAHALLV